MRKLYALVAGLFIVLVTTKTNSQPSPDPRDLFSETININSSGIIDEPLGVVNSPEECRANFEVSSEASSPLTKKFTAEPWHSEQKRPVYICWTFGDGKDTCIQYSNTDPGPYTVVHHYQQPGVYEVCVKIVYAGGCEAAKCKPVYVTIPDACRVDFEKLALIPSISPLHVTFKALPWHNNNKKPKKICWIFGDGRDTCIEYNTTYTGSYLVTHKYNHPGTYEVCVKILYDGGCEASKCKPVQVSEPDRCAADFERIPATSTNDLLVVGFKAIPSHNNNKVPKVICWKFGDGKDTCIEYAQNFSGPYTVRHRYNVPGTYTVCVKITYYGGCESYKCKPIVVTRPDECRADFERITISSTANPLLVYFKALPWNNNNKKPKTICWKFGDGRDTCINYPENYTGGYAVSHRYDQPGQYEVCIKITYYGGCESYKCKPIVVTRPDECRADFERLPIATTNNPLVAIFKALPWHNNNKKPKTIHWNFGDGRDTIINYTENYTGLYTVRHEYHAPGNYQVCVKITYFGGCDSYKCKYIQIGEPDRCGADFQRIPPTNADDPLIVGFKAIPSHNNNKVPKVICWSFGDGRDTCIEYAQNFSGPYGVRHKYNVPGTYTVCIKILYYGGCEARKCNPIVVTRPDECRADFERIAISPTANPLLVYFKALPWHNNNKKPKTVCWRFGDGRDTCINYPENYTGVYAVSHRYDQPGQYEVCVKIIYFGGCESYKCKQINAGEFCRADFEKLLVNTTADPLVAYFKALPFHSQDKKPKTICWKFGDGKDTCISYPESYTGLYGVRHEYDHPGLYEVCIKITYYGGCEAYKCKMIQVGEPIRCKADLERIPVSSVNNPLLVAFKAIPWHIENKKPKEICWKFGDGKDTCIQYGEDYTGPYVVNHRYDHPGNYEVCVKILYFGGCEAKKCEVVKVEAPGECHVKLFQLTPSITSLVRGFFASPWSSENKRPVRVCWYFGDGTDTCIELNAGISLTQLFIRHTYPAPGGYRACVKILFEGGCIASDCVEVIIRPTTNACGGYMTDSLISPRTFKFKGFAIHNPDDPVAGYRWTFGDGSAATGSEVTHQYNAPGTYEVCLTIKTQRGCETRICKPLHVPGNAQIALQITPNPVINIMHVLFYSTHNEPVNIKVVNGYGVVVRTWTRNATQGANNWDFDVSALPAGAYTLYVQSPNQLSSQLFIKTN